MRYLLLSLLIALFPVVQLMGQDTDQQESKSLDNLFDFGDETKSTGMYSFHVGLRGGVNFGKIKSSPLNIDSEYEEPFLGYLGQLVIGYKLNDAIALVVQSGINQMGIAKVSEVNTTPSIISIQSETALVDYRLDYIETNLLINILVPTGSPVVPYIFAGPSYSYLWKAYAYADKTITMEGGRQYNVSNIISATSEFNQHDYGVYAGIGAEVQFDRISLLVDAGYHHGFYDIKKTTALTTPIVSTNVHRNPRLFNTAWNFNLGVAYKIF